MNKADMLKALAEAGADVFIARRALDELDRRCYKANRRRLLDPASDDAWMGRTTGPSRFGLRAPGVLEVPPDTFVSLRCAKKRDLIDAANYAARRYLARRERRQRLLDTFYAAATLAPRLEGAQVVGDVVGVAS